MRTTIIQWQKYTLPLIAVHMLGLRHFTELSEDQRDVYKSFDRLQYAVETQMIETLSIYSINGLTSK